ncbi:MAG: hypothetical protein ACM3SY_16465 [Candidatus Omnitrophota bacterium]
MSRLTDPITLRLTWHHLMANQILPGFSMAGTGKTRGNLIAGRLEYPINSNATAHLVWEYFNPGSYYFAGADAANWFRCELLFRF